jgi:hypothetical protein
MTAGSLAGDTISALTLFGAVARAGGAAAGELPRAAAAVLRGTSRELDFAFFSARFFFTDLAASRASFDEVFFAGAFFF